jgi:hypothetical protein
LLFRSLRGADFPKLKITWENKESFADGAGRILEKIVTDPSLQAEFEQRLKKCK